MIENEISAVGCLALLGKTDDWQNVRIISVALKQFTSRVNWENYKSTVSETLWFTHVGSVLLACDLPICHVFEKTITFLELLNSNLPVPS